MKATKGGIVLIENVHMQCNFGTLVSELALGRGLERLIWPHDPPSVATRKLKRIVAYFNIYSKDKLNH